MIELFISPNKKHHVQLKERLEERSIARKVIESDSTKEAILKEGTKTYKGTESINLFIDEYESFMKDWYDCRCDKWE